MSCKPNAMKLASIAEVQPTFKRSLIFNQPKGELIFKSLHVRIKRSTFAVVSQIDDKI